MRTRSQKSFGDAAIAQFEALASFGGDPGDGAFDLGSVLAVDRWEIVSC